MTTRMRAFFLSRKRRIAKNPDRYWKKNSNMKCQACLSENVYCIDPREVSDNTRRRRYKCTDCEHRFSTIEVVVDCNSVEAIRELQILITATKRLLKRSKP